MVELKDFMGDIQEEVSKNQELSQEIKDNEIEELITKVVFKKAQEHYFSFADKQTLIKGVFNNIRRLGVLQPLLDDPAITEIMVNGPDNIFVEKKGYVKKLDLAIESKGKLEDLIQAIVAKVNRSVNELSPLVDARLEDGSRVGIIMEPIALNGPILTIRKFPQEPLTMENLLEMGSITQEAADFLQKLVAAKYNIFISGGTSSGKTTFLNILSNYIPVDERIVTIEDSAELQIRNIKNIVRTETRSANSEGKGMVTIRQLIRMSLRMRPDRIVVGEVRGEEAVDMLQAMNTGHDGSLSTGHGNSTRDMLRRLETMVLMGSPLPLIAVRQQISSALDIIIHLDRYRDKIRRVTEITEVVGYEKGEIVCNPLFIFEEGEEIQEGSLKGRLRLENPLNRTSKLKRAGLYAEVVGR